MKKWIAALAVLILLILVTVNQRGAIATLILEKGLMARMAANSLAALDDGLHLALCGAGGPLAGPNASGPCVAVVAGEQLFVVDSGTNGPRNLARMGYPVGAVKGVFLTHFHSDHIDGLGELSTLRWAGGDNREPLPVYGPRGVEQVVDGFNAAYAQDFTYRHKHHGDTVAPLSAAGMQAIAFDKPALGELTVVYERGTEGGDASGGPLTGRARRGLPVQLPATLAADYR